MVDLDPPAVKRITLCFSALSLCAQKGPEVMDEHTDSSGEDSFLLFLCP